MSFSFWPYDEVLIETKSGELTIKTPWLNATTRLDHFNKSLVHELSEKLSEKTLTFSDLPKVNDFFGRFQQLPLTYILPQIKNGPLDKHRLKDESLVNLNFNELLKIFGEDLGELKRQNFEWDQQAALEFASINGLIHPESLFSVARRFHVLELLSNDQGAKVFEDFKTLALDEYKDKVAHIIRQNHFVTENCEQALRPALDISLSAKPAVFEFISAERGHDKILKKSLMHLGKQPEDVAVSPKTVALMAALKYIAGRNFLAFSMAIDAFERNNYEKIDPMAKLLSDKGFDKAASFINLHMKINDEGGHENVAQTFLAAMDLCDKDYALEALKLMEVLSVIMTTITESVNDQGNNS